MTATNRQRALTEKLAAAWPVEQWCDVTVLVAVSGGADSVALARGLNQLRVASDGRLMLAHFNHRLRGAESDADQVFVEDLGRELGMEVLVGARGGEGERGGGGDAEQGTSEESLRNLRYAFLAQAANQCGARYVATGHTRDDHGETVLLNILRGTGLAGLAGIPRTRQLTEAATLIRPLLDVTRGEVLEYLQWLDKPFREDSTNRTASYTRNRIRHELLPLLERDYNPNVREALVRLAKIADWADDLNAGVARQCLSQICKRIPGGVEIQTRPLKHGWEYAARPMLIEAWKWQGWPLGDMSFDKWDELLAFARQAAPPGDTVAAPRMFPGGIRAEKKGGVLRLTRPQT